MKFYLIFLSLVFITDVATAQDSVFLTEKQADFLNKNTMKTHIMGKGTFSSFASYLYALDETNIYTDNPEVAATRLYSPEDSNREYSFREIFDEIAKQTSSKWIYDEKNDSWLFTKPLPFEIEIQQNWTKEIRPGYIFLKPPTALVGMDIYFEGKIDSTETLNDARKRISKKYVAPLKQEFIDSSMREVQLQHQSALFYTTKIQSNRIIWRQWTIIDNNQCFVIVSAIKPENEEVILPDVQKMVQSFKIIEK